MHPPTNTAQTKAQLARATFWWSKLTDAWKQAFNEVALRRSSTEQLPDDMLLTVFNSPNHRFCGPQAPYPNMSFELTDMSGLVGLPAATLVVVTFHQLWHIREVSEMPGLKSLFVYENRITSLAGIEDAKDLEELYVQGNQIDSLAPLRNCVKLKRLYCAKNLISSLDGLGKQHADSLEELFCLPNDNLKNTTAFRFEQETGIRCRKC
jgi:Leucine-rich repeat (LRR) protein